MAAGKIVAEKLREVFKASLPLTKEVCPLLNNPYLPCAAPPSPPPMTNHSIISFPTKPDISPNSPPPYELPTPTMPDVAPTTPPPCESPTKLTIYHLLTKIF